ncbi:diguanylate cyclase domain-containing protein [Streptomyces sp. 4N509B]|uniref:diguanylate cyclase domain-containing protein n=1 Tax=Streptomyces sp. 4N509B TaxID=3457413 RepID=UPI003FCFDAE8
MIEGASEAEDRVRVVVELAQRMAAVAARATTAGEVADAAAEPARRALAGSFAAISVCERRTRGRGPSGGRVRELATAGDAGAREAGAGDAGARGADARAAGAGGAGELTESVVVAPIVLREEPWGELRVVRAGSAAPFGPRDTEFAAQLASVIATGLLQQQRLAEARRLAFTDPLTGLANRRAVDARLDEATALHGATGVAVTLVVFDVNGLKRVNDTYGHAAGDQLLERVGEVLADCAAQLDDDALVARLGGDEFCLLAVGQPADRVVRAAAELCRRARELRLADGVACGVASTGEAIGAPLNARRLFRLADAAQYRAKAEGAVDPVVAGSGGPRDAVVALADAPTPPPTDGDDRRRFRGRATAPAPRP